MLVKKDCAVKTKLFTSDRSVARGFTRKATIPAVLHPIFINTSRFDDH